MTYSNKNPSFHISVDDVLPSLLEISDSGVKITDNQFFNTIRKAWEFYGVKVGLHLFYLRNDKGGGSLRDVRCLSSDLQDGWIFFGPHALDEKTPPYNQSIDDQIVTFEKINIEINRIAPGYKSKSIRLHHYSECYENAEYFLANGVREIFTTDKPIGLHRFGTAERESLSKNGYIYVNKLRLSKTHFRIENLANDNVSKKEFLKMAGEYVAQHKRLVIYSHEYEHSRDEVNKMFLDVCRWLTEDLNLECEQP